MDNDTDVGVFLRYKFTMNFIRIVSSYISPCSATFVCDVALDEGVTQYDLNVRNAFDRIKNWISIKDNAILYSKDNPLGKMVSGFTDEEDQSIHNEMILLPYEPVDDMLALVMLRKLNSVGGPFVEISSMTLTASDSDGIEVMAFGEHDEYFPSMVEWMGKRTYFSQPWWDRNDSSSIDTIPPENADLNSIPDYAISLVDTIDVPEYETKILRPEFKPRVIKGDLDV